MIKEDNISNEKIAILLNEHNKILHDATITFMNVNKTKIPENHILSIVLASSMRFFITNIMHCISGQNNNEKRFYIEKIKEIFISDLEERFKLDKQK